MEGFEKDSANMMSLPCVSALVHICFSVRMNLAAASLKSGLQEGDIFPEGVRDSVNWGSPTQKGIVGGYGDLCSATHLGFEQQL